jgi:uncharacterized protein (TIGR00369 family)
MNMTGSGVVPDGFVKHDPDDPYEANNELHYIHDKGDGSVEVGLLANERHANEYGAVHGGVMMMLADAALCMNSRWPDPDEGAITVQMNTDFVDGAQIGEFLETRSTVVRRTGSFSFMHCEVHVGGRVVLAASGIIKRLLPRSDG